MMSHVWLRIGLVLTSCSLLMLELLSARLLTVLQGAHLAFMTLSLAMFGLSAGALYVVLHPSRFQVSPLGTYSYGYAVSILLCLAAQLRYSTLVLVVVTAVPFFLCGVCLAWILSSRQGGIGGLYALDLLGAGLGAGGSILALQAVGCETAILGTAALACLGTTAFHLFERGRSRLWQPASLTCLLLAMACLNQHGKTLRIPGPELVLWNSYSRVTAQPRYASSNWSLARPTLHYWLEIDNTSGTPLIQFNGNPTTMSDLARDITALAFHLRPAARVAVLGAGAGKDALTSWIFCNRDTTAVEMNDSIVELLRGPLKEFSGNLVERVGYAVEDARNWMMAQKGHFDIIQLAMVDNANALASGAIVLCENGLYTREAWRIFVSRLSQRGLLSVSMAFRRSDPAELHRCVALGADALRWLGVEPTPNHFLIYQKTFPFVDEPGYPDAIFTLLLARRPFTARDRADGEKLGFETIPCPAAFDDEPVSDSRPYFFFSLASADDSSSWRALWLLSELLLASLGLTLLCTLIPWRASQRHPESIDARPDRSCLYFALLGLGYMLVEFAFIQRLGLLLGNPGWSLVCVLSTMLLCSGAGSACSTSLSKRPQLLVGLLVLVLVLTAWALPSFIQECAGRSLGYRGAACALLLAPSAFLMGLPFPIGMSRLTKRSQVAWCWALNGAGGLLAAPLAMTTALFLGIPAVLALGTLAYVLAAPFIPREEEA